MTYQCIYELFNNTGDILKFFDMSEIIPDVFDPTTVTIDSGSSHKFYGNNINFERIKDNMKAKCFELGIPNNKQGIYLTFTTVAPTELEE